MTEEPGRVQSKGCKELEATEHAHIHISHIIYMDIQNNLLIGF